MALDRFRDVLDGEPTKGASFGRALTRPLERPVLLLQMLAAAMRVIVQDAGAILFTQERFLGGGAFR